MADAGPPPDRSLPDPGRDEVGVVRFDPWTRGALARDGLVLAVAAVLAVATAVVVPHGAPPLLLGLAFVYVYGVGGVVLLHVVDARREARQRGRQGEGRSTIPVAEVVEAAVWEERRRLALDIRRVLLEALSEVHEDSSRLRAHGSGTDLAPAVARIRVRTQLATSELRRLLGILRAGGDEPGADVTVPQPSAAPEDARRRRRATALVLGPPPRRDVLETVVIVALAAVECFINLPGRPGGLAALTVATTMLAGALFVGRAAAPVPTAVAQGLVFAIGAVLGAPVMSGAWMVRGVGVVLWRAASAEPRRQGLPAAVLLAVTVLATRQAEPTVGVVATWAVVLAALVGGLVTAVHRHRAALALEEEDRLRQDAEEEVRRAVTGVRLRLARELHDTVSHSVGVIAMQLNVLDVARTDAQRERALEEILATSAEALRDLGVVGALTQDVEDDVRERTLGDLFALVDRMRGTGAQVEVEVNGTPPPAHLPVLYRLAQEALTNALLHAPGAAVHVRLESDAEGTRLRVLDDGPGPAPGATPARYGTIGLRERVQLARGSLHLGRGPHGGFLVSADLPAPPRLGTEEARHDDPGDGGGRPRLHARRAVDGPLERP